MLNIAQLQDKFAYELGSTMETAWDSIKVHYESASVEGEHHQIFIAIYFAGGVKNEFDLSLECLALLEQLQAAQSTSQAEPWTWCDFTMSKTGKYAFNFQYGMPPQIAALYKK